jgi:hypothetical protein
MASPCAGAMEKLKILYGKQHADATKKIILNVLC